MGQIMLNGNAYAGGYSGACGYFVDTTNVIQAQTSATSLDYTATQDCAVFVSATMSSNTVARFLIDGAQLYAFTSNSNFTYQNTIFLRRGQTLTTNHSTSPDAGHYTVYGLFAGLDSYEQVHYEGGEKAVGTWVDGKPLYQKTYAITVGTTNFDIDITSLNADKVFFDIAGSYKVSSDGNIVYLGYYVSGQDRFSAYYRHTDKCIRVGNVGSDYTGSGYITIRYTKAST